LFGGPRVPPPGGGWRGYGRGTVMCLQVKSDCRCVSESVSGRCFHEPSVAPETTGPAYSKNVPGGASGRSLRARRASRARRSAAPVNARTSAIVGTVAAIITGAYEGGEGAWK